MYKVGIVGYGNLGKGVSIAVNSAPDLECVGIFTRREPNSINPLHNEKVFKMEDLINFKSEIDVLILCGGSATDLPKMTKEILKDFNTVDSFDTHAKIPEYFNELDKVAKENGKTCAISIGWDPGLFSLSRMLFNAFLPNGKDYTFWGKGVSQGHSDAIRRIDGVSNAIQYTIPKEEALELVRSGKNPTLATKDKHIRECFVSVVDGENKQRIEKEIKEMPNYFADYLTIVNFVSEEEVKQKLKSLAHGGMVIRSGNTTENKHLLELSIKLDSNPEFTGSVLTAYARAVAKMKDLKMTGAYTVFDIPPKYLSSEKEDLLRATLL